MDLPSPPNDDSVPSADDDGGSAAAATPTSTRPKFTPSSTWRKKPSQKGRPRLRLVKHPRATTPKRPVAPRSSSKRKAAAAVDGAVDARESHRRPAVRRKLDLDGEHGPTSTKISNAPATVRSGSFRRATLMDNLRSGFAKLALTADEPPPPPTSPEKINLRCFGRVQLMENLRSLAKIHNLLAAVVTDQAPEDNSKGKKSISKKAKKKPPMVDELVLVPYNARKRRAAGADDEDPFRALVVHHEFAGELVPRWTSVEFVRVKHPRGLRLVKGITPAIEAAYGELMQLEETCRGRDLPDDVPDSPQLDEKRRVLEARVKRFMEQARRIIGDRKFSMWKGSVVTSVVGTFLTQNVTDQLSSNAFMNLAAEFPLSKNGSNVVKQGANVPFIKDGCDLGESERADAGSNDEGGSCCDKGIEELIAALRTGEVANWGKDRIREVLYDSFEKPTAAKIFSDIASMGDTSHWNSLLKEAYDNGYRKGNTDDTVDWEALLNSPFAKIAKCIQDRGSQFQMAFRILAFLIRIKRDHGSIDLEWLRYVPRAKAKRYLRSINGLGAKSVDCIRLLSLRHRAFPVDTNVARIVTRLGWLELEPLPDSQEFHLVSA
ncbi:hypothetical protein HU200_022579 [Digitaria exilis]|uniref:HhH-GPD domain-containing protein n=1 Tax=Digitaria exilis TaxID=1010633 RepID=A0A835C2Q6_9POAL|nr:hypothetical protein HU200_022579 [Digitaria exilis]